MAQREIRCIITGKSYIFSKEYYDKKIAEYLDEDNLRKYYITRKAKLYLNKGYSVQEIRNILNVTDSDLPSSDSSAVRELIDFHKVKNSGSTKKISNTLNFATHKSDPLVVAFINTIKNYE